MRSLFQFIWCYNRFVCYTYQQKNYKIESSVFKQKIVFFWNKILTMMPQEYKKDICINLSIAATLHIIGSILTISGFVVLSRGFQDDVYIAITLFLIGGILLCAGNVLVLLLGCTYGYRLYFRSENLNSSTRST